MDDAQRAPQKKEERTPARPQDTQTSAESEKKEEKYFNPFLHVGPVDKRSPLCGN